MFSNRLISESSPYLLQHAHNPVDWYPWGEEAWERARNENKPVLVSIGYAACHWCHVMERESFEDVETAEMMNANFINIKIDREERPDLDHIYMDAIQAMTGSGGWPLNVFLTPDKKPFYGGTYFPPVRAFNRASWKEVMTGVAEAFRERRHEIDAQAENLTAHLQQANAFGMQRSTPLAEVLAEGKWKTLDEEIMKTADQAWGGFGNAPKFPQFFVIQFLLRQEVLAPRNDKSGLKQALLSLDKMIDGGIYDQIGGGLARYSTDIEWLAPHFEKMLYDNALLITVLSEAFQLTKNERYREVIHQTMRFIKREMLDKKGGFYAALDADSEGEEGKFYVWTREEIEQVLGKNATLFSAFYDVSEKGNWEGKNILRRLRSLEDVAAAHAVSVDELKNIVEEGNEKLLERRGSRVRPQLDDKVILGWNALMNSACSRAYAATGKQEYRDLAINNMTFLLKAFATGNAVEMRHTWKGGKAKYPAFLDDYAFLIQALLQLQEVTGETGWLVKAGELAQFVIDEFSEVETGYFYYTREGQDDVIVRKKEVYDGAQPSGNSIMADNLYRLAILLDRPEWKERSGQMLGTLGSAVQRYPTSFGCWANLLLEMGVGTVEIAIVGRNYEKMHLELLKEFIPNRVLMATSEEGLSFPLLAGKQAADPPLVYVCRDYACRQPETSIERVMSLIYNRT